MKIFLLALAILGGILEFGCNQAPRLLQPAAVVPATRPPRDLSSAKAVVSYLKTLPSPHGLQVGGETQSAKATFMMSGLQRLSSVDTHILDEVYHEEHRSFGYKPDWNENVTDLLRLLTRVLYRVEDVKGHWRVGGGVLDDGSHPKDWLWPLEKRDGKIVMGSSRGLGAYTGAFAPANSEYVAVKKLVLRRKMTPH